MKRLEFSGCSPLDQIDDHRRGPARDQATGYRCADTMRARRT